jgi:hypothetical protein
MPGRPASRVQSPPASSCAQAVPKRLAFALNVVEPATSYTDSWPQLVWGLGIWACGIGAVVTGVVAMVRHHERSWMVALATVLGLLPLALLVSEIALGKF